MDDPYSCNLYLNKVRLKPQGKYEIRLNMKVHVCLYRFVCVTLCLNKIDLYNKDSNR